jgi:hypothetical protein
VPRESVAAISDGHESGEDQYQALPNCPIEKSLAQVDKACPPSGHSGNNFPKPPAHPLSRTGTVDDGTGSAGLSPPPQAVSVSETAAMTAAVAEVVDIVASGRMREQVVLLSFYTPAAAT